MSEIRVLIEATVNEGLRQMILSKPAGSALVDKIKVRPVMVKGGYLLQEVRYVGPKVFHRNMGIEEFRDAAVSYLEKDFKQAVIETQAEKIDVLISKKGKVTVKRKRVSEETGDQCSGYSHDRKKNYILEEGTVVPFLVDLGVQTKEGRIIKSKYDKFRQINRFLELIRDVLPTLSNKDKIKIVDFGCGKSYLTFAMYYYLKKMNHLPVKITGLDLKEDVIKNCSRLAEKYGYEDLDFLHGDIGEFESREKVDMVVCLHACDTATDHAIYKSLLWNAEVIMAVPCCQHEVNGQIAVDKCYSLLKYGLIRERISALLTDGIRGNILEDMGYEVQIVEFIDMDHTPKNMMIRAVRNPGKMKGRKREACSFGKVEELTAYLQVNTTLQRLMEGFTRNG